MIEAITHFKFDSSEIIWHLLAKQIYNKTYIIIWSYPISPSFHFAAKLIQFCRQTVSPHNSQIIFILKYVNF